MTRLRSVPGAIAAAIGRVVAPFRPEPGTTEGAVYFGLALIAVGFFLANRGDLAFIVPGAVIALLGSAPAIVGILRGTR